MRKKSLVTRARVPKLSDDSDPDDTAREQRFQKNAHRKPVENCERLLPEDCGDGEVPRMKKPRTLGDDETAEDIDWLKTNVCIVCDGEDDEVLVCYETGCLVALHGQCMNDEPDFDELGNFYCPYCWHKRKVLSSVKLKERVMAAKKAVTAEKGKVMDKEVAVDMDVDMEKTSRETENVVKINASFDGMRNLNHCENRRSNGKICNQSVELENNQQKKMVADEVLEFNVHRDRERRRERHLKEVEGSKREKRAKDQRQGTNKEKGMKGFDLLEDDGEREKEPRNKFCEDEQREANASPTVSSTISRNGGRGCDPDAQGFALVVRPMSIASPIAVEAPPYNVGSSNRPPRNSQIGNRRYQAKKVVVYNSPTKRNFIYGDGKRKRLNWTPEEEEMLRVGVQEFAAVVNKNIPWRKILEFGKQVFHEERTPVDLKDKWKNMNKLA